MQPSCGIQPHAAEEVPPQHSAEFISLLPLLILEAHVDSVHPLPTSHLGGSKKTDTILRPPGYQLARKQGSQIHLVRSFFPET